MSSNDNRKVDPGCATIIGAVIGAIALIAGVIIGAVVGAKSQPIQVFLGSDTPTAVAQSNILGLPFPQPTYTVLPTYTPYPTLTPPRTIVVPKPITVIPTSSSDQQNPQPGSVILAGQGFAKNGVTVSSRKSIDVNGARFSFLLTIENQSSQQLIVRWANSYIHTRDDKGKVYRQENQNNDIWDKVKQFSIPSGNSYQMSNNFSPYRNIAGDDTIDIFTGPIDPSAKYLVLTADQMAGMANMNWRFDLQ